MDEKWSKNKKLQNFLNSPYLLIPIIVSPSAPFLPALGSYPITLYHESNAFHRFFFVFLSHLDVFLKLNNLDAFSQLINSVTFSKLSHVVPRNFRLILLKHFFFLKFASFEHFRNPNSQTCEKRMKMKKN